MSKFLLITLGFLGVPLESIGFLAVPMGSARFLGQVDRTQTRTDQDKPGQTQMDQVGWLDPDRNIEIWVDLDTLI